jgi:Fic family protein
MLVLEEENQELYDRIQETNLIRQYDLLTHCIEIGLSQGGRVFDKYMLWNLNHVAVANISQRGGRFREEPILVGNYKPPHFRYVPELMDQFIITIHENWYNWADTELAAYGSWRLNWIHPFIEGNGRTARAASYYLLCAHHGALLGGRRIVPERIRDDREPYYAALRAADRAWESGDLDISVMEEYLAGLVEAQLADDGLPYQGASAV